MQKMYILESKKKGFLYKMVCVTTLHPTCVGDIRSSATWPWWFFLPALLSLCVMKLPVLCPLCSLSGAPPHAEPRSLARLSWALIRSFSLLTMAISASMASGQKSDICDTEEVEGRLERGRLGAELQAGCGGAGWVAAEEDGDWTGEGGRRMETPKSDLICAVTWNLLPFFSLSRWGEQHSRGCTWWRGLGISFSSWCLLVNYNM